MSYYDGTLDIGGEEYEILAEIGSGGGYDWTTGALLRGPDGSLYWTWESGCSCNGFGDNLDRADLSSLMNESQAIDAARSEQWAAGQPVFTDSEVYEFAKAISELPRA